MTHPLTGGYDDLRIRTAIVPQAVFRPVDEQYLRPLASFLLHYKQPENTQPKLVYYRHTGVMLYRQYDSPTPRRV